MPWWQRMCITAAMPCVGRYTAVGIGGALLLGRLVCSRPHCCRIRQRTHNRHCLEPYETRHGRTYGALARRGGRDDIADTVMSFQGVSDCITCARAR